jgi:hypothetical protein
MRKGCGSIHEPASKVLFLVGRGNAEKECAKVTMRGLEVDEVFMALFQGGGIIAARVP